MASSTPIPPPSTPFSTVILISGNSNPNLSRKNGSLSFKPAKPVPALKITGNHKPRLTMQKMNPPQEAEDIGELAANFALVFQNDMNGMVEDNGAGLFAAGFLNGMNT